jgi:hypothetical protein
VAGIFLSQLTGPWKYIDGGVIVAGWILGFAFNEQSRRAGLMVVAAEEDEAVV